LAKARAIARGETVEEDEADAISEGEDDGMEGGSEDGEGDEEMADAPNGKRDLNVGAESIASLSAKTLNMKLKPRPPPMVQTVEVEEEEEEIPVLINRDLPNLKSVLHKADIVLEVLDSRDPLAFRSKHLEQLVEEMGKKLVLLLNKIGARVQLLLLTENDRSF